MPKRILTTPQNQDPGAEGGRGYDYQWHVGARMAIQMLCDKDTEYIVCEFHEDMVNVNRALGLKLVQIKKRETQNWTMHSLVAPEKKQRQGIFCKLFTHLAKGKDVQSLLLMGHGRVSGDDEFSLPGLMSLLKYPIAARDLFWQADMQKYIDHFCEHLTPQGLDRDTILKAVAVLDIDFSLPHPEVIEHDNCQLMDGFLHDYFEVELSMAEIRQTYDALYKRVKQIAVKPGQPWTVKSISRSEATDIVFNKLKGYRPTGSRQQTLTAQDKLSSVGMGDKIYYAIERRLEAMRLRFELELTSAQWETFRTEIDYYWREFRDTHPDVNGPALWISLRTVLSTVASGWVGLNSQLGADFAEGVFFDMTGTCEARWSTRA